MLSPEQLTCWILLHHPLKKWVSVSAAAAAADEIFTPAAESGETFFFFFFFLLARPPRLFLGLNWPDGSPRAGPGCGASSWMDPRR